MTRPGTTRFAGLIVFAASSAAVILLSSCSSSNASSKATPAAQQTHGPNELWGDMKPVVSVKELMRDFIDPASDYVFDAVGTVIMRGKRVEKVPRTDEDWDHIRVGAVMLAEGADLLKVPRAFAPAGDENNSRGPEPEELSPAQIIAKLERDPVLWNAKIQALRNVGLEVLDIVKRRDANELWDASDNLDQACENCHLEFWYPGEKAYLRKLDQKLEDLYGRHEGRKLGMDPR